MSTEKLGSLITPTRRQLLQTLGAIGIGSTVFQRALAAQVEQAGSVTPEMIAQAEWIAGLKLSEEDRKSTSRACRIDCAISIRSERSSSTTASLLRCASTQRHGRLGATTSHAVPWLLSIKWPRSGRIHLKPWLSCRFPSWLRCVRTRQISSLELTKLYLERLRKYDPVLHCVVTYTEELALKQAEQADREIAAGRYRGPLHGIPWGAKDLVAYPGYRTTWGAAPFKDQVINVKATAAQRLEDAGAVLVAKLSLGALAMGDQWFNGMTRTPWNPKLGSSGSSAGPASATAAGLVGFAIGGETLGSIVSPCRQCGTTGLRPTFGRVSLYGCMSLAWSMDKLGPITRCVEDCAWSSAPFTGPMGSMPRLSIALSTGRWGVTCAHFASATSRPTSQ